MIRVLTRIISGRALNSEGACEWFSVGDKDIWIQERRIQKEEVFVTAYDWGFIR